MTTRLSRGSCRCQLRHSSNRVRCLSPLLKPWHWVCGRCYRPILLYRQPALQVRVAAARISLLDWSGWQSPVRKVLDRKNTYFPAIENKFALRQSTIAWEGQAAALPTRAGTVREFLAELEQGDQAWPVWRDELFLELHRGCATSRPDQKRHNRTLERLFREADAVSALLAIAGRDSGSSDWRPLLFQQFHDILPGTSIPEVFDQAEPVWRSARRQARQERDRRLARLPRAKDTAAAWSWWGLQPLASWSPLVRLPAGSWSADAVPLPQQTAAAGGTWVQLPRQQGICSMPLRREPSLASCAAEPRHPVRITSSGQGVWRVGNGLIDLDVSADGLLGLRDRDGREQLSSSLQLERYRDRGEFWGTRLNSSHIEGVV